MEIPGNPKVKPTVLKYRVKGETILRIDGQLAQIEDKDGVIWALLELLDGKYTCEGVINKLITEHTHLTKKTVEVYIEKFIELGILEDATLTSAGILDDYSLERWSRNFDFFGSIAKYGDNKFAYQKKIQEAKICLLGCGGVGTHVLFDLAALGFSNITIVDFDKIELANLNRQILYHEKDIGKAKVQQAKKRILQFSSKVNINIVETFLDSTEKIASVIDGHDLVICVVDKPRYYLIEWLNAACVSQRTPFIYGGVDIRRTIFCSVLPGKSGCMECWRKNEMNRGNPTALSVANLNKQLDMDYSIPIPAMVVLVTIQAGCMVAEALKLITSLQPPALTNKLKAFNFDDMVLETCDTWEQQPNCSVCGTISV
jgi:molybdopterin/thiamine biosynthesis adenylyltransferase